MRNHRSRLPLLLSTHSVMSDSFATPWTVALGAPLSKEFHRGEYWSGLPFPPPGHLPHTGIKPQFPALQEDGEPPGKPLFSQFSSVTHSCPTLCNPTGYSTPGLPVHHQLQELVQTHVHQGSDAIQPSRPRSSPSPHAAVFPSIRGFPSESVLRIRWAKDRSSSFSSRPSNEYSGLISFRMSLQSK